MPPPNHHPLPRLGFLGLGWIGRRRLAAVAQSRLAHVTALADSSSQAIDEAALLAPRAAKLRSLDDLLREDLDGVVIATPSGLHFEQTMAALGRGLHVFCQKPLTRTAAETKAVIDLARDSDRHLGVDYSYRRAAAFERVVALVRQGALGNIYAVTLTFHNAYGPDKGWCKRKDLAGGGCLIDLGVHLIDLALQALDQPTVSRISAHLFAAGKPLDKYSADTVEDFASASFDTDSGTHVRLECSWWRHAGQDAQIEVTFVGTQGAVIVRNVNGSFFDFAAERLRGNVREPLIGPPDDWEGRTIVDWAKQLASYPHFDPSIESTHRVATVLDRMYAA